MKRTSPFLQLTQAVFMLIASLFSLPAMAQSAGDSVVNLGWFDLDTHDSSDPLMRTQPTTGVIAKAVLLSAVPIHWGLRTAISLPIISR